MLDFKDFLSQKKPVIWNEIQKYLPTEGPFNFTEVVSDYPKRQGKYGRGCLVLLSCEAFGGDVSKAVKTAAAMQMSEDWLLVHDDFMDNSEERRGKLALHKIYGNVFAINAGDYLHLLMWKILLDNRKILDNETFIKIMKEFERFLDITIKGQHLESYMTSKVGLEGLSDKDYEDIAYGKSAEYTIAGPLRLGAIVAGKDENTLKKLTEVGIPLGIGFQIRDDLLNIVGKGSVYGKEIGGDIFEGKRTLLLIHLVNNTHGEEHRKVLEIMSKKREEKTSEEVEYVIRLMKEKGSIEYAEKKAQEFADSAIKKFNEYFPEIPNRELFESAIGFFTMKRNA